MNLISVQVADVSSAWLSAARRLHDEPRRKAIHTVVQIVDPVAENPAVREAMDLLLAEQDLQCVETVANTIFPEAFANDSRDHAELVDRYVKIYPLLRKRFGKNGRGTYFGRLIQYPTGKEPFDQIGAVIDRILIERNGGNPKHARYEATVSVAEDATSVPIYVPGRDNSPMAFPCLSHCSFQTDPDGLVHLLATYRSQYLVQRGYGNYLGLGRLLAHVARQTGLRVGHLTVVAGVAHLEPPILPVRAMLGRFADLMTP
ncbi:hypothetical protein ACTOB_003641 [Actinoplanes oblitus]|uniref:Thymidylate synthase n=1 Tax=Actinoplanes oblitus TaxID=3040509 RepID=A0ABY8WQ41_9ACTN|nr:hypothetical protein [Actinoplanes oblitus]WIM99970.1 hypothetical protein ACTOB_003641 [Actinoplanes oblitus]